MSEALKRLNVNLDPETHQRFKLAATAAGTDMSEAIETAGFLMGTADLRDPTLLFDPKRYGASPGQMTCGVLGTAIRHQVRPRPLGESGMIA